MVGTILLILGIIVIFGLLMLPIGIIIYQGCQESARMKRSKESRENRDKRIR